MWVQMLAWIKYKHQHFLFDNFNISFYLNSIQLWTKKKCTQAFTSLDKNQAFWFINHTIPTHIILKISNIKTSAT